MMRVGALDADRIDLHGTPAWSVTGTPADCVNLAIHNLLEQRPDIVVSGTNIGKNIGLGFIFASGTVGACIEAYIAGLSALALSQELDPEHFQQLTKDRALSPDTVATIDTFLARFIPRVWRTLALAPGTRATT